MIFDLQDVRHFPFGRGFRIWIGLLRIRLFYNTLKLSNITQGELVHREDHYKMTRVKIKIQKAQFSCNLEYFSLVDVIYQ